MSRKAGNRIDEAGRGGDLESRSAGMTGEGRTPFAPTEPGGFQTRLYGFDHGACRGAKPLCVFFYPPRLGVRGLIWIPACAGMTGGVSRGANPVYLS